MKVSLWAEIRRLHEIEKLSQRAIVKRLHCGDKTVRKALRTAVPPLLTNAPTPPGGALKPYHSQIDALIAKYPNLSAVRVLEEITRGPEGFGGSVYLVRRYLQKIRPDRGRVYQEVLYEPGEAMQVDWGDCGTLTVGQTTRRVSVFVAVLCFSRLCYIEFTLSQHKAEFYRALVNALTFYGGSPKKVIFDNLKAAVLNGSGRHASLHPEFAALCGYFCMEPIACERRDPESKGMVEGTVRYVKYSALAGRSDELVTWDAYRRLGPTWRDDVANVRIHATTHERPIDRFEKERRHLRPLPAMPFDTDEVLSVPVTSHARIRYDGNRYSVPAALVRKDVTLRANATQLRIIHNGQEVTVHQRCYDRRQVVTHRDHQLEALKMRRRHRAGQWESEFDALGPAARQFHLKLLSMPVKTSRHLGRLLALVRLYGRKEVLTAIGQALEYQTYDAAYVETLVLQQRRRCELPSPIPLRPQRNELIEDIHLEEPDPARYDRLFGSSNNEEPSS
ncbi:MAG: IS21 family transposase [Pirellulales bacterium]